MSKSAMVIGSEMMSLLQKLHETQKKLIEVAPEFEGDSKLASELGLVTGSLVAKVKELLDNERPPSGKA